MYDNYFTGELPSEMGRLTGLTHVHLYRSLLNGTIPSEIGRCTSLKEFLIADNTMTGTLPSEISALSDLRMLYLSYNTQLGGNLETLYNLTALEALDVNETSILLPPSAEESDSLPDNLKLALHTNHSFWNYYHNCNRRFPCG